MRLLLLYWWKSVGYLSEIHTTKLQDKIKTLFLMSQGHRKSDCLFKKLETSIPEHKI